MKKQLIIISSFLALVLLSSCSKEEVLEGKYYSTGSVFSGSVDMNNSYIGYIKGDKMLNLATKVGGRISSIYVKEGDFVQEGDLLVKLDGLEAKTGYASADMVLSSLYSMRESTKNMFDEQIVSMQAKVDQVKEGKSATITGLEDIKNITNSQLETAKTGLETAKANLEHTRLVLETKQNHIYDNSKDAIVGAVILDTNILNFVDILLGITEENDDKNDSFEDYLSAKNTAYLIEAKNKFLTVNESYKSYKEFYDNNIDGKSPSKEIILEGLSSGESLAEELKGLLSVTYDVIDSSIENVYFPLTTINSYKKQISDFGINIEASLLTVSGDYILGLKGSRQGLAEFEKARDMQLDLLEKQVELAEKTYNQYVAMSQGQVHEVEAKKNITYSQLDEILAGLESLKKQKDTKLKEIDAKISEAKGQRDSAGVMINAGEIRAPISGIITGKMGEIGQVVGGGMPILSISNEDNLELNILISEQDLANVLLGDKVLVEVDGLDRQVSGIITNINPSKDLITKRIGVEISIQNDLSDIKIGSYAKVILSNSGKDNKIVISNNAIISKFMIPGVYVLKDGVVSFKNIEILKQNNKFSEISGLSIGDIIILDGKENIWDGEELN